MNQYFITGNLDNVDKYIHNHTSLKQDAKKLLISTAESYGKIKMIDDNTADIYKVEVNKIPGYIWGYTEIENEQKLGTLRIEEYYMPMIKKVRFNTDDKVNLRIPIPPIDIKQIPKFTNIVVIGSAGSGKTILMKNLLSQFNDNFMLMNSQRYDQVVLNKAVVTQRVTNRNYVLIFDECIDNNWLNNKYNNILVEDNRKLQLSNIFSFQNYKDVPQKIRNKTDWLLITGNQAKKLYDINIKPYQFLCINNGHKFIYKPKIN